MVDSQHVCCIHVVRIGCAAGAFRAFVEVVGCCSGIRCYYLQRSSERRDGLGLPFFGLGCVRLPRSLLGYRRVDLLG